MQQHITFQQFNELDGEKQIKLKNWLYSVYQKEAEAKNPHSYVTIASLGVEDYCLSIGRMIEFLMKGKTELDFSEFLNIHDEIDKNLCARLWEAVKKVLVLQEK